MSYLSLYPQSLTQGLSYISHLTSVAQNVLNSRTSPKTTFCVLLTVLVFFFIFLYLKKKKIPRCFSVAHLIISGWKTPHIPKTWVCVYREVSLPLISVLYINPFIPWLLKVWPGLFWSLLHQSQCFTYGTPSRNACWIDLMVSMILSPWRSWPPAKYSYSVWIMLSS